MKFEENNCMSIPKLPQDLVYFLIDVDEVVYVGQTKIGIVRPMMHKDKKFTDIMIMPVDQSKLDEMEEYYISKYSPKYNKILRAHFSMLNARDRIRNATGRSVYSVRDLRKDALRLGVQFAVLHNGKCYISPSDLESIISDLSFKEI